MLARWFRITPAVAWHALDENGPEWSTRCGGRVITEPHLIQATEDSPYPPEPCRQCRLAVAFDDVQEETLEEARGRGYYAWDPASIEG